MYSCNIICDSVSPAGARLTTMEICFPRIVLAEFNTHRMLSRNSASSRAIPFTKQLERIRRDVFIPARFPLNDKGMQPNEYIGPEHPMYETLKVEWLAARDAAIEHAQVLYNKRNIHKQIVNRLLEPWMWHTVIVTATDWDNFFALRCDSAAQAEIKTIADMMYAAYHDAPAPQQVGDGLWHCPYIDNDDLSLITNFYLTENAYKWGLPEGYEPATTELMKRMSVARCARVSFLNHLGTREVWRDLELFLKLQGPPMHASPFEHVATPHYREGLIQDVDRTAYYGKENLRSGNFNGWKQYRKYFPNENITHFRKEPPADGRANPA